MDSLRFVEFGIWRLPVVDRYFVYFRGEGVQRKAGPFGNVAAARQALEKMGGGGERMIGTRRMVMVERAIYSWKPGRYSVYLRRREDDRTKNHKAGPFGTLKEARAARKRLERLHPVTKPGRQADPEKRAAKATAKTRRVEPGIYSWAPGRYGVYVQRQGEKRKAGPFSTIGEARAALREIDKQTPCGSAGRKRVAVQSPATPKPKPQVTPIQAAPANGEKCRFAARAGIKVLTSGGYATGKLLRNCPDTAVVDGYCHWHGLIMLLTDDAYKGARDVA